MMFSKVFNIFLIVFTILIISSCGFQPVYQAKKGDGPISDFKIMKEQLASVKVGQIGQGRKGQLLKTDLENLLNPLNKNYKTKYNLDVNLSLRKDAVAIQQDRAVNRYNLVYIANFALKDLAGKILYKSRSHIIGSFDKVSSSDFATYSAEKDTSKRILKEMAQDIHFRIVSFLSDS